MTARSTTETSMLFKYSQIMSKFETSPQSKRGPPISPSVVLHTHDTPKIDCRVRPLDGHRGIRDRKLRKMMMVGAMLLRSQAMLLHTWYYLN